MTIILWLTILFVVLQFGDAITTLYVINKMGGYETNKYLLWMFERFGMVESLGGFKLLLIILIIAISIYFPKYLPAIYWQVALGLVDARYIVAVYRNLMVIRKG